MIVDDDSLRSDELLSATVRVNELCPDDNVYPVMVTFGTRPVMGRDEDCEGQENTTSTAINIPSGDSHTFSVSTDTITLRDDEEYCYTISLPGMFQLSLKMLSIMTFYLVSV